MIVPVSCNTLGTGNNITKNHRTDFLRWFFDYKNIQI